MASKLSTFRRSNVSSVLSCVIVVFRLGVSVVNVIVIVSVFCWSVLAMDTVVVFSIIMVVVIVVLSLIGFTDAVFSSRDVSGPFNVFCIPDTSLTEDFPVAPPLPLDFVVLTVVAEEASKVISLDVIVMSVSELLEYVVGSVVNLVFISLCEFVMASFWKCSIRSNSI